MSELNLRTVVPDAFPIAEARFAARSLSLRSWYGLGARFAGLIRAGQRGPLEDLVAKLPEPAP